MLKKNTPSGKKQKFLRLGGLMGTIFFGGLLILRYAFPQASWLIALLLPFLLLSLFFFIIGYIFSER